LSIGRYYQEVWERFLDVAEQSEKLISGFVKEEMEKFDCEDYSTVMSRSVSFEREEVMSRIVNRLVGEAEKVFSPRGGRLEINCETYKYGARGAVYGCERNRREKPSWREFRPADLWEELEKKYGGDKGAEAGYRQAAKGIASAFDIKEGMNTEIRSGKTVLSMRVYSEKYFASRTGGSHLSYGTRDEIVKLMGHLESFASWAGLDGLSGCTMGRWGWDMFGSHKEIISRERFRFGEHMELVTFNKKFEFHFSPEAAEQLQMFLGTFLFGRQTARAEE